MNALVVPYDLVEAGVVCVKQLRNAVIASNRAQYEDIVPGTVRVDPFPTNDIPRVGVQEGNEVYAAISLEPCALADVELHHLPTARDPLLQPNECPPFPLRTLVAIIPEENVPHRRR